MVNKKEINTARLRLSEAQRAFQQAVDDYMKAYQLYNKTRDRSMKLLEAIEVRETHAEAVRCLRIAEDAKEAVAEAEAVLRELLREE